MLYSFNSNVLSLMKNLLIIALLTAFSGCVKEQVILKGQDIRGIYKFRRVTLSEFDNGTSQTQTAFMNGMTYTNPWDVPGLNVVITDVSLVQITSDSIYFNSVVSATDTSWQVAYPLEGNVTEAYDSQMISFYPIGLKRTWKISGPVANSLIVSAPIHWPQGSAGSAWSITYLIEKL